LGTFKRAPPWPARSGDEVVDLLVRLDVGRAIEALSGIADDLRRGILPKEKDLADLLPIEERRIAPNWEKLMALSRRLETLAHKQLRRAPFNASERGFVRRYGETLAEIMSYHGNAYLYPKDDAPKVCDVCTNLWDGRYIHVGVGRPRAIWVLYPYGEGEVLCRGAVLPYYEFKCDGRLSDAEWKALLDSPDRPSPPAWLKTFLGQ
jgi:hypothetical protein